MKKTILLGLLFLCAFSVKMNAQCTLCIPIDCSVQKPAGGLCNQLPDDTAGQPYDAVISFYMPKILNDPQTLAQCSGCSQVELHHITIVGMQGLPTGVIGTPNHSNGYYDVWAGDSFGCVHFCGTPVAPGTYYLVVNLLADVVAKGTPIGDVAVNGKAQNYQDTIQIFPGTSVCPQTFSLGNGPCILKACDSVAVNLNATLTNTNCPNLISYSWDLGNGQTPKIKTPGVVNYITPDTFHLSLTTTYYTYRVKNIYANISGGYTGDIEELTSLQSPDPYVIIPSLGFNNRSSAGSDVHSVNFNNVNLVIPDNNCATPLEIQVWDEDTGPPQGTNPVGSPDDNCGSHYLTPSTPNQVADIGANSSVGITFDTVATSSVTENVDVIVFPHAPVPVITASADSICAGDSTLLSLQSLPGYAFHWYQNDTTELQQQDSAIWVKTQGVYKVRITNVVTGCEEWSAPDSVAVGEAPPTAISIIFTGTREFVTPYPGTNFSVDWYYNDNLVVGQNGKFLPYLGDGVYTARLYNASFPFCSVLSDPDTVVAPTGINEAVTTVYDLNVFPNPNTGKFNVKFSTTATEGLTLNVSDMVGQVVLNKKLDSSIGDFNEEIDLSAMSKGVYLVTIESKAGREIRRVVVQ